jgi:hypothetical protein
LRAYPLQTHEMLFDAHNHAFAVFGGVPRRGIYDNMKTAVDRVRSGKARDVNARFAALVSHYLFEAEFCNPASGWEKGQIEKNMQDDYVADQFLASAFDTKTFAEKIFKLTEGFNAAQGKTAADLFGVATAVGFSNAAAGIGKQIFGRLPDFADVATVGDLHDLIDDLDVGGLRDAIRDLSATVERTGRRDPLAWASFVVAAISLVGLFVQIAMDYAKVAEKTQLRSAPTTAAKTPVREKQPRAQVLVVRAKRVAIRIAPSTTQTKIGEAHEGALLTILNVKAGWARVDAVDLSGEGASVTGWIPLRYTTPVAAESMHTLVCALLDASDTHDNESCVSSDPPDVH